MGNSAAKDHQGGLAVCEATQVLLDGPATSEFEEDGVWDGIFASGDIDAEVFYEAFSVDDVMEMREVQPGNLKLLARKALSNISCFMEAQRPGPSVEVVRNSLRTLTRVLPAMLSDPSLRSWCWRRRRLASLLINTEVVGGIDGAGDAEQDVAGEVGDQGDPEEEDDEGDGDEGVWSTDSDFPVCFASVALHTISSLLAFPGFAVDDEATDWDDFYTPIPALHYGIREASVIWAPGVAVTDHNMREVSHLNANRVELLRLLVTALSLPLFCDVPSKHKMEQAGKEAVQKVLEQDVEAASALSGFLPPAPAFPLGTRATPGLPPVNPLAGLATSRHLPFATELFYSLLNVAVIDTNPLHATSAGVAHGSRRKKKASWRLALGTRATATEEKSPSLVEWCMQTLALLLRHGRPYKELLADRDVFLKDDEPFTFGSIPRHVEESIQQDPDYNCHRRCVFVIHSDEDLDRIAMGLLRHLNDGRLGKTRRQSSVLSTHQEALMVLAAFVHENPRFVPRLAASEELTRGTVTCVCTQVDATVSKMIEKEDVKSDGVRTGQGDDEGLRDRDVAGLTVSAGASHPKAKKVEASGERAVGAGATAAEASADDGGAREAGPRKDDRQWEPTEEDVGSLLLTSRLLLTLTEDERFMTTLAALPAGGRRGEFSTPVSEYGPGSTLVDTVMMAVTRALAKAFVAVRAAAPALAAVARNCCPYLVGGMKTYCVEWMVEALEMSLGAAAMGAAVAPVYVSGTDPKEGEGGPETGMASMASGVDLPVSTGVASLLLEGLAACVAFHFEEKSDLVVALVERFQPPQPHVPPQSDGEAPGHAQAGSDHAGCGESMFERGGALRWLAARGGMLEVESGATFVEAESEGVGQKKMRVEPEESWFRFAAVTNPWEGWALRRVLWPLVSVLMESASQTPGTVPGGVEADVEAGVAGQREAALEAEVRQLLSRARTQILRPLSLCPPWSENGENGNDEALGKGLSSLAAGLRPKRNGSGVDDGDPKLGNGGVVELARMAGAATTVVSALKAVKVGGMGGAAVAASDGSGLQKGALYHQEPSAQEEAAAAAATGVPFHPLRDSTERASPTERAAKWMLSGGAGAGANAGNGRGSMDWVSTGGDMVDRDLGSDGGSLSKWPGGAGPSLVSIGEPWQSVYLWRLLLVKTEADIPLFDRRTIRILETEVEDDAPGSPRSSSANGSSVTYDMTNDRSFFADGQGCPDGEYPHHGYPEHEVEDSLHHGQEEEKCNGRQTGTGAATALERTTVASREEEDSFTYPLEKKCFGKLANKRGQMLSGESMKAGRSGPVGPDVREERDGEDLLDGVFEPGGLRAEELV